MIGMSWEMSGQEKKYFLEIWNIIAENIFK